MYWNFPKRVDILSLYVYFSDRYTYYTEVCSNFIIILCPMEELRYRFIDSNDTCLILSVLSPSHHTYWVRIKIIKLAFYKCSSIYYLYNMFTLFSFIYYNIYISTIYLCMRYAFISLVDILHRTSTLMCWCILCIRQFL